MYRLIALAARYPRAVLVVVALLCLAAVVPLERLRVDVSADALRPSTGPAVELLEHLETRYGTTAGTTVLVVDDDLFTPGVLAAVAATVDRLTALPFVTRVQSLYSVPHLRTEGEEVLDGPFLDPVPATTAQAQAARDAALGNALVAGELIGADGRALTLQVETDGAAADETVVRGIAGAVAPLAGEVERVVQVGAPRVREAIAERIRGDQLRILPLALAGLAVMLMLLLGTPAAGLLPLATAGVSILWTLAGMAVLGVPVGILTSIVPVLLVIIGSTEDVHLLAEYLTARREGHPSPHAVALTGRRMGGVVTLTAATTYVGFLSIAVNDLALLREFGLVASTGLLLNFLVTVTLVPALLRLWGGGPRGARTAGQARPGPGPVVRALGWLVTRHRDVLIGVSVLALGVAGWGATRVILNHDVLDYFPADAPVVADTRLVEEYLAGSESFSILVTAGIEDTFLKRRYLQVLQDLQAAVAAVDGIEKVTSFADYLAMVHGAMTGWKPELPEEDAQIQEYALFLSPDHVGAYVAPDYSEARIVVRHHLRATRDLRRALGVIRDQVATLDEPGLTIRLTGPSVLGAEAAESMARGQVESLTLMVAVIFVVVSLLFWNPWAGVVALVPNLLPIAGLFGVMGYGGIPLNNGTAMVAAIAIGICVDDTLHFMVRYHDHTRDAAEARSALLRTLDAEWLPIFGTSVALAAGFAILGLSSFPPVAAFGLLSAMVMGLALVATFMVTPVMLSTIRLITLWEMMSLQLRSAVLMRCVVFRGLKPRQVKRAVLLGDVTGYRDGDYVVRQGDPGREMYVVLEGGVEVWRTGRDGARDRVKVLGPGEVFGEIALVSRSPRTADVRAHGDTRVLVLRWDSLERIARQAPVIAARLFGNLADILAHRLVQTEDRQVLIRDLPTGAYSMSYFSEHLALELEKARRYGAPLCLIALAVREEIDEATARHLGELALAAVAERIRRSTRKVDVLARWSGTRFVILLSRADRTVAESIVERIEDGIAAWGGNPIRVRAGVAEYRPGEDCQALLGRLETALGPETAPA